MKPSIASWLVRFVLATGCGWLSWVTIYVGTHEASLVDWYCDSQGCSTNDLRAPALVLGAIAGIGFMVTASVFLGRGAFGAAATMMGMAAATGWSDAIADFGVAAGSLQGWIVAAHVVASVGAVLFGLGAVSSIRRSGLVYRFTGRKATVGRAHSREAGSNGVSAGVVSFIDETGHRHDVAVRIGSESLRRPVTVFYDPSRASDSNLIRVGLPRLPASSSARDADMARLRELLPLPEDAVKPAASGWTAGGDSLTGQLERLAGLHETGALSDSEFEAAKRKLLG